MIDLNRLQVQLLNSKLQKDNPPLYQVISTLIKFLQQNFASISAQVSSVSASIPSSSSLKSSEIIIIEGERGEDGIDGIGLPGERGLQGIPGVGGSGSGGGQTIIFNETEECEYPYIISGPAGLVGAAGSSGSGAQGIPGIDGLDGESFEYMIPGPQGIPGPAGIGSGADIALSLLSPAVSETITTGRSAVVLRKYKIASGTKLIIESDARFRVL